MSEGSIGSIHFLTNSNFYYYLHPLRTCDNLGNMFNLAITDLAGLTLHIVLGDLLTFI